MVVGAAAMRKVVELGRGDVGDGQVGDRGAAKRSNGFAGACLLSYRKLERRQVRAVLAPGTPFKIQRQKQRWRQ